MCIKFLKFIFIIIIIVGNIEESEWELVAHSGDTPSGREGHSLKYVILLLLLYYVVCNNNFVRTCFHVIFSVICSQYLPL